MSSKEDYKFGSIKRERASDRERRKETCVTVERMSGRITSSDNGFDLRVIIMLRESSSAGLVGLLHLLSMR